MKKVKNLGSLVHGETLAVVWYGETFVGSYDGLSEDSNNKSRTPNGKYIVLKNGSSMYDSVHWWTSQKKLQRDLENYGESFNIEYNPIETSRIYRAPKVNIFKKSS